jgi:hypothetical protein
MKIEKFFFPLTIVAAIITVWVVLRNSGSGATAPVSTNPNYVLAPQAATPAPTILTPSINTPGAGSAATTFGAPGPSYGNGSDWAYIAAAQGNPWANNPRNPANPNTAGAPTLPTQLTGPLPLWATHNLPPWLSFQKQAAQNAAGGGPTLAAQAAGASSGGCSGGCGGCSGGCGGKGGSKSAPYFPGGTAPLAPGPQYQIPSGAPAAVQNLGQYAQMQGNPGFQRHSWYASGGDETPAWSNDHGTLSN